jgi:hypothetical protein
VFIASGEPKRTRRNPRIAARAVTLRRRIPLLVAALAVIVTAAAWPAAGSARAASTGYVYLVTPHWWSWCPGSGNYVTFVYYVNGSLSSGGDGGDDIVYAKVNLNASNTIVMADRCAKTLPQGGTYNISPTRTGQTWWLGYPSGTYHN